MIRPVEVQGVVQRSQDISGVRQNENTKGNVEQANIQAQTQKTVQAKSEQVIRREHAAFGNNKFDAKEKGKNEYINNRKKGNNKKKSEGNVVVKKNTGFDVKA